VEELLEHQARQLEAEGFSMWCWREHASGDLVGQVGLNRTDVLGENVVEVGWSISPEHWNKGLATEAARASLDWGFEQVGLDEIVSFTMVENGASRRVMEKLGMRYDREFEREGLPQVLFRTTPSAPG
jgi:ribosomal-protein-alanine N-acetyltransferase